MTEKPELLLPAGTPEALRTAFLYGADAVYAGIPSLSLRANAGFTEETLAEAVQWVHSNGKKIYLALNLFSRNDDIAHLSEFAETVKRLKPDGLIVSDPGVFMYMKEHVLRVPLHVSTQANVGSWLTVKFWQEMGASMCVLSRETSFEETKEIKRMCPDIRLEMFVHGAMCVSYSGRCLLSSYMAGRSGNRGKCAHACRWEYKVYFEEALRPGEFLPVEEDKRGTYIMNSRDLCLMPKLNHIIEAGIDCFKIEGRNKTPYYVAQTARTYRKAIDDWFKSPQDWSSESYMAELETLQNRGYTLGFYDGVSSPEQQNYDSTQSSGSWRNAGVIREWTEEGAVFTLYQKLCQGDVLTFLSPFQWEPIEVKLPYLIDFFSKKEVAEISPGRVGQALLLPHCFFSDLNVEKFPPLTVARIPNKHGK